MINRERLKNKSVPLAASVPVKFVELRPSRSRCADRRSETYRSIPVLRFGELVCRIYNWQSAHRKSPCVKTAQGRHIRLNFSCNTQLKSRDSIGSVALAQRVVRGRAYARTTIANVHRAPEDFFVSLTAVGFAVGSRSGRSR